MDIRHGGGLPLDAALQALDCGIVPILLLGTDGGIAHANGAARMLLEAGRIFGATNGRLRVQRQADQDAIDVVIAGALDGGAPGAVHLRSRQGDITHVMSVTPLAGLGFAVVSVAELRGPILLGRHWSREALGLPASYADLAEALANGENLAEFATRAGLTIGGVRTRLKKLLKRLSARSQSDLVSLLLRAAATLPIR